MFSFMIFFVGALSGPAAAERPRVGRDSETTTVRFAASHAALRQ